MTLVAALKDNTHVQQRAVKALIKLNCMNTDDLLLIATAYPFYIWQGTKEDMLIKALNVHGNKEMATDYLNSGNVHLSDAANSWAKKHGYQIAQFLGSQGGPIWSTQR